MTNVFCIGAPLLALFMPGTRDSSSFWGVLSCLKRKASFSFNMHIQLLFRHLELKLTLEDRHCILKFSPITLDLFVFVKLCSTKVYIIPSLLRLLMNTHRNTLIMSIFTENIDEQELEYLKCLIELSGGWSAVGISLSYTSTYLFHQT